MLEAIILTVFYASLAALAAWTTWRDEDLRWLGGALILSFVVSNFVFWLEQFDLIDRSVRPGIYSILEVLVATAAYCSWCPAPVRRCLIGVVVAAVVSICANVGYASILEPTWRQISTWEWITNLCFAAECLLATVVGIHHGLRAGRFHIRALDRWLPAASHAHREGPDG